MHTVLYFKLQRLSLTPSLYVTPSPAPPPKKKGRAFRNIGKKYIHISTWSYENRVSKHFVIFLNFLSLIACLLLFAYGVFFACFVEVGICVEVDVDRITILLSIELLSLLTI